MRRGGSGRCWSTVFLSVLLISNVYFTSSVEYNDSFHMPPKGGQLTTDLENSEKRQSVDILHSIVYILIYRVPKKK